MILQGKKGRNGIVSNNWDPIVYEYDKTKSLQYNVFLGIQNS